MNLTVFPLSSSPVITFAAEELCKYIKQMTGVTPKVIYRSAYCPAEKAEDKESAGTGTGPCTGPCTGHGTGTGNSGSIWLGPAASFAEAGVFPQPDAAAHPLDDAVMIKSAGQSSLLISGPNERSVLFSVYAYLESLGCRFLRIGEDGEVVPKGVPLKLDGYHIEEYPSYRYRGICIEGAVSIEHVRQIIDYMTKKRFNTYFLQFMNAYIFWSRWYDRKVGKPEMPIEVAEEYTREAVAEVQKRGLALQMVGHGWTCECLGVRGLGWHPTSEPVPKGKEAWLAELNGRREWFHGIPINTELCLSNSEAFNGLAAYIADYAARHPEVDLLHIWMSDGANNRCECPACAAKLPADQYVELLNAVDERLTALGSPVKLVFLAYCDLLWAPEKARFRNPERFVLMFAPISRTYRRSLLADHSPEEAEAQVEPLPYRRNRNTFPKTAAGNIYFLRQWQKIFSGDSFIFDYHLLWKHSILEPTGLFNTGVLHKDIQDIVRLGLNGMVNCQVQRYFFPTGVTMEVSGKTLWNKDADFAHLVADYFKDAFHPHGDYIYERVKRISRLMDAEVLFMPESAIASAVPDEDYQNRLAEAATERDALLRFLDALPPAELSPVTRASCQYLRHGMQLATIFLQGMQGLAAGDIQKMAEAYREAAAYLLAHEEELNPVCDVQMWHQYITAYAANMSRAARR